MCRSLYRRFYFHEMTVNSVIELSTSTKCLKVVGKIKSLRYDIIVQLQYSYICTIKKQIYQ